MHSGLYTGFFKWGLHIGCLWQPSAAYSSCRGWVWEGDVPPPTQSVEAQFNLVFSLSSGPKTLQIRLDEDVSSLGDEHESTITQRYLSVKDCTRVLRRSFILTILSWLRLLEECSYVLAMLTLHPPSFAQCMCIMRRCASFRDTRTSYQLNLWLLDCVYITVVPRVQELQAQL